MKAYAELLEFIEKSLECDPWMRGTGMEGYCKEAASESKELVEAVDKNDITNIKEEIGDVLRDLLIACKLAEERGLFTLEDVYEGVLKKVKHRQPYVLEGKKVTKEEAVRIWMEAKKREKNG
jgi:tetrapyrrole methylase family protein / MazG family protein